MTYCYLGSEVAISTFLGEVGLEKNGSNEEMDIVMYATVMHTTDINDKHQAIIIELKKTNANYKENGTGINQLFNYSAQFA